VISNLFSISTGLSVYKMYKLKEVFSYIKNFYIITKSAAMTI